NLCPASLIIVSHAERRGDRKAARPDARETGLFYDLRAQSAVGLHQETHSLALYQAIQLSSLFGRSRRLFIVFLCHHPLPLRLKVFLTCLLNRNFKWNPLIEEKIICLRRNPKPIFSPRPMESGRRFAL